MSQQHPPDGHSAKSAAPPPSVSAPPPPKLQRPPRVVLKGPPLNRWRADLGAIESLRDDLEYALGGMRPGAALAARRRCALDVLDLVADHARRGAAAARGRGAGGDGGAGARGRVGRGRRARARVRAPPRRLGGGVEPGPDYVACAVRVLEPTGAAPPLAAADAAPLGAA